VDTLAAAMSTFTVPGIPRPAAVSWVPARHGSDAVEAWRRDQGGEAFDELQRGDGELGATIALGLGQAIDEGPGGPNGRLWPCKPSASVQLFRPAPAEFWSGPSHRARGCSPAKRQVQAGAPKTKFLLVTRLGSYLVLQAKQRAHCAGVAHRVAPRIIIEVDENIQLLRLPFP
jgi:hypothetical protein